MNKVKNERAALAAVFVALLVAGCSEESLAALKVGEVVNGPIGRNHTAEDRWIVNDNFPVGSSSITYLGKGWFSFLLKNDCYLYRNTGQSSVLSLSNVCN